MKHDQISEAVKRDGSHLHNHQSIGKPKKKQKKLEENPFENMALRDDTEKGEDEADQGSKWVKPKTTPLTVTVADHSRTNKFYSHKSLQKYISYLYVKASPNPAWLSIRRQSQIQHIIFLDIEIENNLFHYFFTHSLSPQLDKVQAENQKVLSFLSQFNTPESKAVFKQSPFIKESRQVLDAMLVYDNEAIKQETNSAGWEGLPGSLSVELFQVYETYVLTEEQRKYNLYPIKQLPAYKQYFQIPGLQNVELKNKILVIDCEMVMSGNNFQLARTSIMNFEGELIYDEFFKPDAVITNYNTQFSGITQETLKDVHKKIRDLHEDLAKIVGKQTILVGHSLENDLHAMKFIHQKVIDTSVLFARKNGSKMKLKTLAYNILSRSIQVGSHCSEEDCKATLDLMRYKIEISSGNIPDQHKVYHLLGQLQEEGKKVVIIDSDLDFIKHRKQYLGVHFQDIELALVNPDSYIGKFEKYFDKNARCGDFFLSRIRNSGLDEWENYYRTIDNIIRQLYEKCCDKTVFFLNFQVNNSYQVFPLRASTISDRRRPFCLFVVKSS